jgi:hypothetical protein
MFYFYQKLIDNLVRDFKISYIYVNSHVDFNLTKRYVNTE